MMFFYKGHLIVVEHGFYSVRIAGALFSCSLLSECVDLVDGGASGPTTG